MKPCIALFLLLALASCSKDATQVPVAPLIVSLPKLQEQYNRYYLLDHRQRSLVIYFSEPIDTSTVFQNILFGESTTKSDSVFTLSSFGRMVVLAFKPQFQLKEGWRYFLTIAPGLKTTTGFANSQPTILELRTTTRHPGELGDGNSRNSIVCISDIHMGDARGAALGYSWFGKNNEALDSLLMMILNGNRVRQLVILGDLFDEWAVPYRINPFDPAAGITGSRDYFNAVANAPVNAGVVQTLRAIAASGIIQLVYIPGNHDMLLTEEILTEIIPGIIWKGDAEGLGSYSPVDEIIMEHGHRYDFFNCPQPVTNPGHLLPPGYLVTRLDAEGLMETHDIQRKPGKAATGSLEFLTAWTAAYTYLLFHYSLTVAPDSANILMGGINDYAGPLSFNGMRDLYAQNIEDVWPQTSVTNRMPVAMPALMAILNGSSDLYATAAYEYMQNQSPLKYGIVVFGHTHHAMLSVYPSGPSFKAIYANTGTWVNDNLASHPVRTFIEIQPAAWTGSALDIVSLYQYNPATGSGNGGSSFVPVLLDHESVVK